MASDVDESNGRIDEESPPSRDRPIEPGSPRLEHVVFVVLGALGTVLTFMYGLNLL